MPNIPEGTNSMFTKKRFIVTPIIKHPKIIIVYFRILFTLITLFF